MPAWKKYQVTEVMPAAPSYLPALPVNHKMLPPPFATAFKKEIEFEHHKIYAVQDVYVSWDGAVFKNLQIFTPSLVKPEFRGRFQDTFLLRQWFGEVVTLPEAEPGIAVAHNQWSAENYYHWMVDTLPRLLILRNKYPNYLLLVPQPLPPKQFPDYIQKSASVFGFTKYYPLTTNQILKAEHLVLAELTAESLFQNPELMQRVRAELIAALCPEKTTPTRRIYASRATQSVRRLVNEADIEELLQAYGFETVFFEQLSFLEQVQLMRETKIFMGTHGANMTNLMFLPHESTIIELLNKEDGDLCYFRLASCFSLPYFCVPCESTDSNLSNQADLRVDLEELKQIISTVLK
ncbi:glycosyltransferase family 61 protein [Hymenobacter sp. BT188]|uniref:glycosyltransferase family 61 protein n=1 Tax=Hymenobacter sp. BT188 TaxID=2763504 RepID=UPI00165126B1|nr:glycosyltransferase family 61 protein [Hymenobacter sp. BT188]MBC6607166.1 glycosyltransferase family 61 protein [Hymenobacter sp. BT188]